MQPLKIEGVGGGRRRPARVWAGEKREGLRRSVEAVQLGVSVQSSKVQLAPGGGEATAGKVWSLVGGRQLASSELVVVSSRGRFGCLFVKAPEDGQ